LAFGKTLGALAVDVDPSELFAIMIENRYLPVLIACGGDPDGT